MRPALAFALSLLAAAPAFADEIHVTANSDDPSGTGPGSLRNALRIAKDGDTIVVDVPDIWLTGPIDVNKNGVTLCGNGVRVRPAYAKTNSPIRVYGNGATIKGCAFTNLAVNVEETVTDTTIVDDTFEGGDEKHDAVTAVKAKRTRIGAPGKPCRFKGASIYTLSCDNVTITDDTFDGGGISTHDDVDDSITDNTIDGKKLTKGAGIAVAAGATGTTDVGRNTVTGFTKGKTGAGIAIATAGGKITLHDNTATGNAVGVSVAAGAGQVVATANVVGSNTRGGWQCVGGSICSISGGSCTANHGAGISCAAGSSVTISQVAQGGNTGAGISVAKGANGDTAPPSYVFHDYANGKVVGRGRPGDTVEVCATESGQKNAVALSGEGAIYIGSVVVGADGTWSFPASGRLQVPASGLVTCTETSASGTSQWSANVVVTPGAPAQQQTAAATPETLGVLVTAGSTQTLCTFAANAPGTVLKSVALTGLQPGELIRGTDLWQFDMKIHAISIQNRVYIIDAATGACTPQYASPLTANFTGTIFGFQSAAGGNTAFRLVTDTGGNWQIHPFLLQTPTTHPAFSYNPATGGNPEIVKLACVPYPEGGVVPQGAQYPVFSRYYGFDLTTNGFVKELNEFAGTVSALGPPGVEFATVSGFDASLFGRGVYVLATTATSTTPHLFSIDIATGAATDLGATPFAGEVIDGFGFLPPVGVTAVLESNLDRSYSATLGGGTQPAATLLPGDGAAAVLATGFAPSLHDAHLRYDVDAGGAILRDRDPWIPAIAGLDLTAPTTISVDGPIVMVTNGDRIITFDKQTGAVVVDTTLTYLPTGATTPLILAAHEAPASLNQPAGTAIAIDAHGGKDGATWTTVTVDTTTGVLSPRGVTGVYGAGTHAAWAQLDEAFYIVTDVQGTSDLYSYEFDPSFVVARQLGNLPGLPNSEFPVAVLPWDRPATDGVIDVSGFSLAEPSLGGLAIVPLLLVTGVVRDVSTTIPLRGVTVLLSVGDDAREGVLDSKGTAKVDGATFKFTAATATKPLSFAVTITGADIPGALADEGMDGTVAASKETRHVDVSLTIGGAATASATLDLVYSAIPGKKATATLAK